MTQPAGQPGAESVGVQLEVDWSVAADEPIAIANTFLVQPGAPADSSGLPDGIYLTAAHAVPPVLVGSAENIQQSLDELRGRLPLTLAGRLYIPRDRVPELIALLQTAVGTASREEEA